MQKYWLACDIETAGDDSAMSLLEEPAADKRLTDHAKIAADVEAKRLAQIDRMALDPFAGRIVAIGWQTEQDAEPYVLTCETLDHECSALLFLANLIRVPTYQGIRRHILGYNAWRFDMPYILTRARLLGVPFPDVDLRRYGNRDLTDLYQLLTCDGVLQEGVIRRTLATMAKRFGMPVTDDTRWSDVAAMVKAGDWTAVVAHCKSDVALTVELARRLGVITLARVEVGA